MEPIAIALTLVSTLIKPLTDKAFTALLEQWARLVGLDQEFVALKEELKNIKSILGTAGSFPTNNSDLLDLVQDLQQLAYEADDLLDELDYYRIQHDVKRNARNFKTQASVALQKLGPFGGDGGGVVDMDTTAVTHISSLGIRHGLTIDALIIRYQGFGGEESTVHWGGQGGQLTEIAFQPNEYIVAVRGHVGHYCNALMVRSLKFETNFHSHGPFGMEEGTPFELSACGGQITGFHARCGLHLDAIGAYVKITDSTSSSSGIKIVSRAIHSVFKQACCSSAEDGVRQLPISIPSRITMSNRIKKLAQHLRAIGENVREGLKVEAAVAVVKTNQDNQAPSNNPRETTSYITTEVYGREQEQGTLINLLVGDKAASQKLSVIAIVGHGGVGKTTLAQLVYNHQRVETHFNLRMWVTVSVKFDVKRLTKEILECSSDSDDGSNHEITNLDKLQITLEKMLEKKRFLLVLDDLWEDEDTNNWEKLLAPLRNGSIKGNVVLVTTRKPGIKNLDHEIDTINLEGLEKDQYWSLFKALTFGDDNYEGHKSLQLIGREIVEKLKGNPLAAKTVGALLRNLDESHWRRIMEREEWKHHDGKHGIMPALRISYEYLSFHLQRCFSYCGLFPKDYKFTERELVNIWIAQGFLYIQGKKMEEVGKDYLDDLIDSGFFQKIHGYYKKGLDIIRSEDAYVIHDLLHDLAQDVSMEECFSVVDGRKTQAILPTTRHLSVLTESLYEANERENGISKHFFGNLEHGKLSTIMLFGDEDSIDQKIVEKFQSKFRDANGLRVLRLQTIPVAKLLLSSLISLTHLRYLQLCSNYSCDTLPAGICRLYHLQVLDVCNWKNLVKLPNNFNNLINLRHFIPGNVYLYLSIAGVGKLTHLQQLGVFRVKKESEFAIEQLGELKELRGELSIYNLENVKSIEEAKGAKLKNKTLLNSLELSWENPDVRHAADTDVLEGLQPHCNLKKLKITGYGGSTSPTWLNSKIVLTYLENVILFNCTAWEILPPLGKLQSLKRLELKSMSTVREIGPDLYGCGQYMAFQCLEEMILQDMPKLARWVWNDLCQNLPALLKLSIYKCPELDLPLSSHALEADFNKHFPRLVDLHISECHNLLHLPPLPWNNKISTIRTHNVGSFERVTFSNSEELSIHNPNNQRAWDDISFHNLKAVTSLEITSNRYPLLWENLCSLGCLQTLNFKDSPVLFLLSNKVLDNRRCLQSLKKLELRSCGITGKQLSLMLQHAPSISELLMKECYKIKSIKVVTKMNEPNLTTSQVVEVEEDEGSLQIPSSLTSLEKLHFWNCPDMVFKSEGGLSGLVSIRELEIADCTKLLESMVFPPGLQHLTMDKAPEGTSELLEGLSSLRSMTVQNSQELKTIDLTSCSALEELHFLWCSELTSLKGLESLAHLKHLEVGSSHSFADAWVSASDIGSSLPLECLDVDSMDFLAMPICKQLSSLQHLIFRNQVMDLTEEQEESLLLLTSLKVIHFNGCKNLRHLPATLHLLPSLEELVIHHCLNMQSPPKNGLPKSLVKLGVYGCGDKVKKMFEECENQLKKRRWEDRFY